MRINRRTHYHTQEVVIPQNTSGLIRRHIKLPKEEFDLITGIGIVLIENPNNENPKLGFTSTSKEFINLIHHSFFTTSVHVVPKDRLMPVLFEYRLDDRVDCRILMAVPSTSEIKFDLVVRVENSKHYYANRAQPTLPSNN